MIGDSFGNYRLVARLGSGAMGTVFLGDHERIARRAAIKVLAPQFAEDTQLLGRFFDEARATSLIHHPAIVDVLDCGVHPDGRRPYIVMEYLEGETLAGYLERQGPLAWPEACAIAGDVAAGLAAAHGRRIVHRDVKPANIMRLAGGVKLLDFGVAKLLHDTQSKTRTQPGQLLGTPEYMAPEQCACEGAVDERTDVYALGCLLFEMICGRPPFVCRKLGDLILAHRWREPPRAAEHAELPPVLDGLIARLLSKSPEARPQSMAEVVQVLAELKGPASAPVSGPHAATVARPPRAGLPAWALPIAAGAAGVVALLVVGSVALRGSGRSDAGRASRPTKSSPSVVASVSSQLPPEQTSEDRPPASAPVGPPTSPLLVSPGIAPPTVPASGSSTAAPSVERRASVRRHARAERASKIDVDGIVDL